MRTVSRRSLLQLLVSAINERLIHHDLIAHVRSAGPWKSGIINFASKHSIAVVFPDSSPRGAGIEGEEEDWDFGTAASFYLDATSEKYKKNYNMYSFLSAYRFGLASPFLSQATIAPFLFRLANQDGALFFFQPASFQMSLRRKD